MVKKTDTKNLKNKYVYLICTWLDATKSGSDEWTKLEEASNEGCEFVHSGGFLIHETRELISLAQSISEDGSYRHTTNIPKGWLIWEKRIKL